MMKAFVRAWWGGLAVVAIYLCLTLVAAPLEILLEALPDRFRLPVGIFLYIVILPPLLFWAFRWMFPDAAAVALGEPPPPSQTKSLRGAVRQTLIPAVATSGRGVAAQVSCLLVAGVTL